MILSHFTESPKSVEVKFADDTTNTGLISENDKSHQVQCEQLATKCYKNKWKSHMIALLYVLASFSGLQIHIYVCNIINFVLQTKQIVVNKSVSQGYQAHKQQTQSFVIRAMSVTMQVHYHFKQAQSHPH